MRLLVRHAHAGDKRQWRGPDADRPLSVRGWGEAEGLGEVLAGVRVERLLSSPSLRCRQTLLPLAATLGLAVEATDDLGLDGDADHLADRLTAGDGDGVALCTHGEVLGALLARLRARGVIQAEGRLPYEKGSTWALEVLEEGRYRARYLPPRVADPARARRGGGARAELGRLAVEQQRLLGSVAMLASRTRRRAARPGPQLAALEAQRAAVASQLDQVREAAGALAGAQARLAATEGPPGRLHHAAPQPPARMVAGLTDAGAVLVAAAGRLARRDPDRQWAVLAEQPWPCAPNPARSSG
jgi:phosphohistidine phosphatase SixA